jgi:hypothetical protein
MGFEVAPTRLRGRGLLPGVAVLIAGLAMVVVGFLAASDEGPAVPSGSASPAAARSIASPPSAPADGGDTGGRADRSLVATILPPPDAIVCHDIDTVSCGEVVRASIVLMPPDDGDVTAIAAWPTILCGDDFDCPRDRLLGYRPLGSAVVSVASGAQAWVNVLEPAPYPGRVWDPTSTEAWVVRWLP